MWPLAFNAFLYWYIPLMDKTLRRSGRTSLPCELTDVLEADDLRDMHDVSRTAFRQGRGNRELSLWTL